MTSVFISYRRRGESAGYAGRLAAELRDHFGPDQLFRDIEKIEPGLDFVEVITSAVASCNVLIAVIGDDWLTATDSTGRRRLDDPQDFLHLEVTTALARKIRVIPVLVGDATMPRAEQLPEPLKALARRQAHELSDSRWDYDMQQLIAALEKAGLRRRRSLEAPPPLLRRKPIKWALGIGLPMVVIAGVWVAKRIGVGANPAPSAELRFFEAEPPAIAEGDTSILRWQTDNADVVKLDGNEVAASDSTEVRPVRTTTYRLSVRSAGHQIDTAVTVGVTALPQPSIAYFEAQPAVVAPGNRASLCYGVFSAAAASIEPGVGSVRALEKECVPVTPTATTTYTLTVIGTLGAHASASATVKVTPE